jgi:hypothetical protein
MFRMILVAALSLVMCANAVQAEEPPAVAHVPSGPIRMSVANVRFEVPDSSRFGARQRSAKRNGAVRKVTAGVALGVVGLFGGALIGASLDRNCRCDDPGLTGAIIGAPIGAIAGAIAGVLLASR